MLLQVALAEVGENAPCGVGAGEERGKEKGIVAAGGGGGGEKK